MFYINMYVVIQVMIGNEKYQCSCVRYVSQHSTVLIVGLTTALVQWRRQPSEVGGKTFPFPFSSPPISFLFPSLSLPSLFIPLPLTPSP